MRQFAKNLITEWRRLKLPTKDETIIVAVSGGADSVSLLAALHELQTAKKSNLKIIVAHFNHQLRGAESDNDAEFVEKLSDKFGFESVIQNPKSKIQNLKGNLEQAARRARYDFLQKTAEKYKAFAVLTGHTLDDQAETFLLRLIRGSGADGLAAMRSLRLLDAETQRRRDAEILNEDISFTSSPLLLFTSSPLLVRPLLNWARREMTENYCKEVGIAFRCDTMNDDERFARVRIRKQLLPLLKTFNPKIVETLANTALLLNEDSEQLNFQATQFLAQHDFSLLTAHCSLLTPALRRRVLRIWLEHQRGGLRKIEAVHLRAIESLILKNEGGRIIELPDGATVTRSKGKLIFTPKVEKSPSDN